MVCIIVLKGILCIKTYNRHPRRRKDVVWVSVCDCHFESFGEFVPCHWVQGIRWWQVIFFAKKLPLIFAEFSEVSSVCHLQTQWNGDGCHFSWFHSLYWKEGDKRVQTKKGLRGRNPGNKKSKSILSWVLGPEDSIRISNSHYAEVWCFKIWNTHFYDKTNQYYTCCKKKMVGELLGIVSMLI